MKKNKSKTLIIAELAQAHDGSIGLVHSYIDSLKNTGVDAIKFQMHFAEFESSKYEKFRVNFSSQDKSRFDYWKRIEFNQDQWMQIKRHCEDVGLKFICSIFSDHSIEVLSKIGANIIKVPSGELSNFLMLSKLIKNKKNKIILSTGLSNNKEIDEAFKICSKQKKNISILHCTSEYPCPPERLGLNQIGYLKKKYNVPVGLSDHSGNIYSSLMAIMLGAEIIEAHVVFDKRMFGPDTLSSITIEDFKKLVEGARFIEKAKLFELNKNKLSKKTKETKKIFGKSMIINKNLPKGSIITMDDIGSLKPEGYGLSPKYFEKIINKRLKRNIKKYEFISLNDVSK